MKPRPFPYAAGHPANHGYVQCADCGCWRRESAIARVEGCPPRCFDVYGCKRWKTERAALTDPDRPERLK